MKRITLLLADDHMIVREGFRRILEAEEDIEVIGEAKNGRQAVALAAKLRPDVVIMDIAMPVLNGLEATGQIHRAHPAIKVLILSAHSEDAYVERALALGAVGYLLKQTSSHELAIAIRAVQQGKTFFSPSVSKPHRARARPAPRSAAAPKPGGEPQNRNERAVGRLLVDRRPKKQIAIELGLSLARVDQLSRSLMRKVTLAAARVMLPRAP